MLRHRRVEREVSGDNRSPHEDSARLTCAGVEVTAAIKRRARVLAYNGRRPVHAFHSERRRCCIYSRARPQYIINYLFDERPVTGRSCPRFESKQRTREGSCGSNRGGSSIDRYRGAKNLFTISREKRLASRRVH